MDKEIQFYVFFCKVEIKDLKDFLQISPRGLPFASKLIKHLGQSLQTEGYPHAPASHWANAAPFSTLSWVSQRSLVAQASLSQYWKASTLDWIPKICRSINSYLVAHEGTDKLAIRTPDSKPSKFHLQPRRKAGQTAYNEFRNCRLQVLFSPHGHPPESWGTSAHFQLLSKSFEPQHPTK